MGGTTFMKFHGGTDAATAFDDAVGQAQYEHGHGGYSGTLAEKSGIGFVKICTAPTLEAARAIAAALIEEEDARIDDKWGPAGCIEIATGGFLFFGWASC